MNSNTNASDPHMRKPKQNIHTVWAPSVICDANSATRQQRDLGFCMTTDGAEWCTVITEQSEKRGRDADQNTEEIRDQRRKTEVVAIQDGVIKVLMIFLTLV